MNARSLALAALICLAPLAAAAQASPASSPAAPVRPDDAELARRIQAMVEANYPAQGPGAAVLVARGDQVIFRGARGEADIEAHRALSADGVFRIGSVTKQIAAAGLLKLVEDGKVRLDDPLSKYVPGYPNGDRITVLMLLNHTSGVKSYTGIPGYMTDGIRRDLTTNELVAVFRDLPVDFAPGEGFAYNNSGYVLLGAVIEAASGKPWHVYLDEALFRPLGMTHTGYGADTARVAQQVGGYTMTDGQWAPMASLSMTQPHAAGAIVSTVDDLLKWNRALHEGRVLNSALYTRMITPEGKAAEGEGGYGFGVVPERVRGQAAIGHGGGINGFSTFLYYLPGDDITVVVLENDDADNARDSAPNFARRVAAAAIGRPYPEPRPIAVDEAVLRQAEGVYRFDGDVTRTLRVVDGKLTSQRSSRLDLVPIAADDFVFEDGFSRIQLIRDAAGKVTSVRFFAAGEGDGVIGVRSDEPLPAPPAAVALPRAALERIVGEYTVGSMVMKIFLDGDKVLAQLTGQPPVNLRPTSATTFEVVEVSARLEFPAGDAAPGQLTLHQNDRQIVFTRKP